LFANAFIGQSFWGVGAIIPSHYSQLSPEVAQTDRIGGFEWIELVLLAED